MAQLPCPNCGGYKLTYSKKSEVIDNRPLTFRERAVWVVPTLGIMIVFGITQGFHFTSGAMVVFGVLGMFLLIFMTGTRNGKRQNIYHYQCLICGYKWSWIEGTAWPQGKVDRNLLLAGAQRLEQEDEELRRGAAHATYVLRQKEK